MEQEVKKKKRIDWLNRLAPYRFRILWTSLFFILAILFLTIGFWKTIVLALFAGVGFLIGKMRDEDLDIYSLMDSLKTMLGI